jgi:hypothetical protein
MHLADVLRLRPVPAAAAFLSPGRGSMGRDRVPAAFRAATGKLRIDRRKRLRCPTAAGKEGRQRVGSIGGTRSSGGRDGNIRRNS